MYSKKLLKFILIIFTIYFSGICLYGLIFNFPAEETLFIEKRITAEIFSVFSLITVIFSGIYSYFLVRTGDNVTKLIFGIFCAAINSIFYFFNNIIVHSFKYVIEPSFVQENAMSLFAFLVLSFLCFGSCWYIDFIKLKLRVKSKK